LNREAEIEKELEFQRRKTTARRSTKVSDIDEKKLLQIIQNDIGNHSVASHDYTLLNQLSNTSNGKGILNENIDCNKDKDKENASDMNINCMVDKKKDDQNNLNK